VGSHAGGPIVGYVRSTVAPNSNDSCISRDEHCRTFDSFDCNAVSYMF